MARPKTFGVKKIKPSFVIEAIKNAKEHNNHNDSDRIPSIVEIANMPFTLELDMAGIVFNIFSERKLGEAINDLLPNKSGQLSSSSWLLALFQRLLMPCDPFYNSSLTEASLLIPMNLLVTDEDVFYRMINNKDAVKFLDQIAAYGPHKFFNDLISKIWDNADEVEVLHGDTCLTQYVASYSRRHYMTLVSTKAIQTSCTYACHFGLASQQSSLLYFDTVFNPADTSAFIVDTLKAELPKAKEHFPNLKRISLPGASLHEASIVLDAGLHVTSRLSNSLKDVRIAKQNALLKEHQLPNGSFVKIASVDSITLNESKAQAKKFGLTKPRSITFYPVVCLNESNRAKASKTVKLNASNQLNKAKLKIKEIAAASKEDALHAFDDLKSLFPLCQFGEANVVQAKVKKTYSVKATVDVDANQVEQAIERELMYVIATTDSNLSPEQIYTDYHDISIPSFWNDMKLIGSYIEESYISDASRAQALYAVLALATSLGRYIIKEALQIIKKHEISSSAAVAFCHNPSWYELVNGLNSNHIALVMSQEQEDVRVIWNQDSLICNLIAHMPEPIKASYRASTYMEAKLFNRLWDDKRSTLLGPQR